MNENGGKCLDQFQRSVIISSASLPKLLEVVKNTYDISCILTYILNEDGLE